VKAEKTFLPKIEMKKTRTVGKLIMLTPTEKQEWLALAEKAGLDLNSYIRACVERRKITPLLPPINYQTVYQLGKVGNNLNQQVKAFHTALKTGMKLPGILENLETVNEIRKLLQEVQSQLLGVETALNHNQPESSNQKP
jgi:hypothetical protein